MNRDSDVDDSESIHKCQKSIFNMLIDNVMLTECKSCAAWAVDSVHTTKNMGCVVNVCTRNNSWVEHLRHSFTPSDSRAAWGQLLAGSC